MSEPIDFFVAGGTLRATDPSYVTRPADHDLLQQLQAGEFCYVLTPRQMGKSSLMVRTAQRLRDEGTRVAVVDLTRIGSRSSEVTADQWYLGVLTGVRTQLRLTTDVQRWWEEHAALGISQRFITFLHDVLLAECSEPVVILIDEIDSTLNLDFRDDFFAAIRALYNERATDPIYQRLTFALFGVATPTDLIQDRERTPFNIGRRIDLREFTLADAEPLREGLLTSFPTHADEILQRIFHWTNGHPYLTQKLCQVIQAEGLADDATNLTDYVDDAVQQTFFSEEGRKDPNLTFVQDRIANSPDSEKRSMLQLYRRVQRGDTVPDDDRSQSQNRLELYGLVGVAQGQLQVRNRIYARVFDDTWIGSMMPVDRRQRRAVLAGVGALVLALGVVLWLFLQPVTDCAVFSERFTENEDSNVRLSALASLFGQGDRCRDIALDLFYSLQPEEHEALFLGLDDYASERERLVTVIDGIYRTLDTVPEHDIRLMEIWLNVLQNAGLSTGDELVSSIREWKLGRELYDANKYEQAVDALSKITLKDHFVIYYDRAQAFVVQEKYAEALNELNTLMEVAERDIPTPTPELALTSILPTAQLSGIATPPVSNLELLTPDPLISPLTIATTTVALASGEHDPQYYVSHDYQRRFNNVQKIRSTVRVLFENNQELLRYFIINVNKYPALSLEFGDRDLTKMELPQLRNGGFEQGSVDWHEFSSGQYRLIYERPELLTVSPHGGEWAAWLGGKNDELSELSQQVTVPIGEPFLRYWYQTLAEAECGSDNATLLLDSIEVDQFALCNVGNIDWTPRTINLSRYAGLTVTLTFRAKTDSDNRHSNLYLDDISWVAAD